MIPSSETIATLGFLIRVPFVLVFTYAAGRIGWEWSGLGSLVAAVAMATLWELGRS